MTHEVELKFKNLQRRHMVEIETALLEMGFDEIPTVQDDTYLACPKRQKSHRVRREREKHTDNVVHLRTFKAKSCKDANKEREKEIKRKRYDRLIRKKRLVVYDEVVEVHKDRLHLIGKFDGKRVTVALDIAHGPDGIYLGRRVEFERQERKKKHVKRARRMLQKLADELLPDCAERETRGYKTVVIEALFAREMKRRREEKRNKKEGKTA